MDKQFDDLVRFITKFIERSLLEETDNDRQLRLNYGPEELEKILPLSIANKGLDSRDILKVINQVIDHSVVFDHPFFMNQMFGKVQPIAFIADIILGLLNISSYTYEVAPAMTLIEKEIVSNLTAKIWGKGQGDGVFTSGGSLSNINALFLARERYLKNSKQKGLFNEKPVSIFVSDQAHYSFTKGVNYLGFGLDSLVLIPSDNKAKIDVNYLNKAIAKSKKEGRVPLLLVGIAGTTMSGSYDDLQSLANIAKKNNIWFHVDAAFGGSFLFSKKLKDRLKGIEHADSVTWNFHKVMGITISAASFLTKEKSVLNKAFSVDANYLFHKKDYDYDLGQKTLQGGRRPDAFKLWVSWKYHGNLGFAKHVEKLHQAALTLATLIEGNKDLTLFAKPESSIVCFNYTPNKYKHKSLGEINEINKEIRTRIFNKGKIILNYSQIHDTVYLRCVLLDPEFTDKQLSHIIDTVINTAEAIPQ